MKSFRDLMRRSGRHGLALLLCVSILLTPFAPGIRAKAASNPLPINVKAVNRWSEGGRSYTQFTVKLTNQGSKTVSNWNIKLRLNRSVMISSGWNGKFSASKKIVAVTPDKWNKSVAPGETKEFGFITSADGKTTYEKAYITPTVRGRKVRYTQIKNRRKASGAKVIAKGAGTGTPKTKAGSGQTSAGTSQKTASAADQAAAKRKASSKTPVASYGRLKVKGTKLVSSSGKRVTLKGVSTHGINWYPEYVNKNTFKELRDKWGVQCIRLAMYTQEYNGYLSGGDQAALRGTIEKGVKYATELGMYVIIDWHILSDGNPKTSQKEAVAFFKKMAKKYKGHKNVIYEICNEPNGGTSWKQIKSYAQAVIKAIRSIDKYNVILVGTPTWSQDVDTASTDPIKGYKNLMYTFHFYAGTHGGSYRRKVQTAISNGLPVFVSEFGISDASGNGQIDKAEGNRWISFLKKNGISYVCWSLSNKNESSALIKSTCTKKSGFKTSELSAQGQWYKKK